MLVIGVDGMDWKFLRKFSERPGPLQELLNLPNTRARELYSDARNLRGWISSAACWTTAFTGLGPEQHGLMDFHWEYFQPGPEFETENSLTKVREREFERRRGSVPWIWRENGGTAYHIPVFLKPHYHNVPKRHRLPLTFSDGVLFQSVREALQRIAPGELFVTVSIGTDHFQHTCWSHPEFVESYYNALAKILHPMVSGREFAILSDHGFTSVQRSRTNGWAKRRSRYHHEGHHAPDGVIITNLEPPLPKRLSKFCGWLRDRL